MKWIFKFNLRNSQHMLVLFVTSVIWLVGCQPTKNKNILVTDKSIVLDNGNLSMSPVGPLSQSESDELTFQTIPQFKQQISNSEERVNDYQLGDRWSRWPEQAFHANHNTVLRVHLETDSGIRSSNVIVLKKLNDTQVVFTASHHAFPSCESEFRLFSKNQEVVAKCTGEFHHLEGVDAVVFVGTFTDRNFVKQLIPVQFANSLSRGERLRAFSLVEDEVFSGYFPLYSDSDKDCLLLSEEEKAIADPDQKSPVGKDEGFWSLAVSCDMVHGDSGALIVNQQNQMVGALWTGAFPKATWSSDQLYQLANGKSDRDHLSLWSQFNYMTPANRIQQFLQNKNWN